MSEENLERYRQRYETWRHLDRLRYRTIQVTVGGIVGVAAITEGLSNEPPIWTWFAIAFFLFWETKVLSKINDGIVANGQALQEYAKAAQDHRIPDTSNRKDSVFYYVEWAFLLLAILSFLAGTIKIFRHLNS